MANAGRILIIPRGKYDDGVTYEKLDLVSYGGKGWICKDTCVGTAPTEGEHWAECIDVSEITKDMYPRFTYMLGCEPKESVVFTPELSALYLVINAHVHWQKSSQVYLLICQPNYPFRSVYIGGDGDSLTFTEQDENIIITNTSDVSGLRIYFIKIGGIA